MKRKGLMAVGLSVLCAGCIGIGAGAASLIHEIKAELRQDFKIVIDGEEKIFKDVNGEVVYPILYEGTTYLPVRAIGEMMGKTVYWYEDDKKIELKASTTTVTDADVIISGKTTPDNQKNDKKYDVEAKITEKEAMKIVLEKAGLKDTEVVFSRTELDKDDGVLHYEIEFRKDNVEYSADVSAIDGKIISWDIDDNNKNSTVSENADIGLEKAKEIALEKAGLTSGEVKFTEQSPDYDDGRKIYEIEFKKDRIEYSADIAAADGAIISWEVDND